MEKAAKEAKAHTSWLNPRADYDEGLRRFIHTALEPHPRNRFLADFLAFLRPVAYAGMMNSLSQTLLKIASPGVPDIYQGNEMPVFGLVDPDNRRPVDYALCRATLDSLDEAAERDRDALLRDMFRDPFDGRLKLYVTSRALRFRRTRTDVFSCGSYDPVPVRGRKDGHAVAFGRRHAGEFVVAAPASPAFCSPWPACSRRTAVLSNSRGAR